MAKNVLEALEQIGALKTGHFLYSSGRHGDTYLEKFDLFRHPAVASAVFEGFVDQFRDQRIDVAVGPTTGGILMAFDVARQLGVAAAFAERESTGSKRRAISRDTTFVEGSRVLVVDDIVTTGGSIRETLQALEPHSVSVVSVAVLVDRSGGKVRFGDVPLFALETLDIASWEPDACVLCAAGEPLVKPGTTPQHGAD